MCRRAPYLARQFCPRGSRGRGREVALALASSALRCARECILCACPRLWRVVGEVATVCCGSPGASTNVTRLGANLAMAAWVG